MTKKAQRETKPESSAAPRLRVVDEKTGEIAECAACDTLTDQLAGAEKDIRAWRTRYASLKRDKEADARKDPLWPDAVAIFRYWQQRCGHSTAKWSVERFELVVPFLRDHGGDECRRAIRGAAFDPYVTKRRNGTEKRHDGFELIFRNADKFDEFRARAPEQTETLVKASLAAHAREIAERVLERAELIAQTEDTVAIAALLVEIDRLNRDWLATPHRNGIDFMEQGVENGDRPAGEWVAERLYDDRTEADNGADAGSG